MKLETNITERDKKLLVLLGIFLVIVAVLVFVLLPGMERNAALQQEITLAEQTKQEMEMKLERMPNVQQSLEEQQAEWAEIEQNLYPNMGSEGIDRIVTGDVLDCGLAMQNLSIVLNPSPVTLEPFVKPEEEESSTAEAASEEESANGISSATVTLTVEGSAAQVQKFVDRISTEYKSVRVASMNYDVRANLNGQGDNQGEKTLLDLELIFYMYEK